MNRLSWLFLLFPFATLLSEDVSVDLKNPSYKNKVITTQDGGIIKTKDLRIHAREFSYSHMEGEHFVHAQGELLIVYRHKFFVGESFHYDFESQTGIITNGVCMMDNFFTGGEEIRINNDGTINVTKAFMTTTETVPPYWEATAKDVSINERTTVKANHLTLKLYGIPVFWYPSFSTTIKPEFKKEPMFTYKFILEQNQDPLFLLRTKVWDGWGTKVYVRGEFRVRHVRDEDRKLTGGGAFELHYASPKKNFTFKTNNFYSYDSFYKDPNPHKLRNRYRLQGLYKGISASKTYETFARWDKLSDRFMRMDFPTSLFELATLQRTEAFVKARYDLAFTSLYGRPRLNTFQGFKQELPTFTVAMKPFSIGSSKAVLENYFKLAYLDYSYADNLAKAVSDFSSSRFETKQRLFYPFSFKFIEILPELGFTGIYYGRNQRGKEAGQAIANYSVDVHSTVAKDFSSFRHIVTPYAKYTGLSKPTSPAENHYIFSIEDGFYRMNEFRYGIKNDFFLLGGPYSPKPRFSCDLYAYSFLETKSYHRPLDLAFLNLAWNYPRLSFDTNIAYNVERYALDHANFYVGWTMNEYLSFRGEFRHRGKYEWRKENFTNYILNVARTSEELLGTPLSDTRNVFMCKTELKLAPFWTVQVTNHIGKRPYEPFYQQTKIGLDTIVSNTWKINVSYISSSGKEGRFTFAANLI